MVPVPRNLDHKTLDQEVFVSNNGPDAWVADDLIEQSLNHHFGGNKWHFCSTTGMIPCQGQSKTIQRHIKASEDAKLPFF